MSDRKNFQQIVDRIDEVTGNAPLAVAAQMTPPAFGKPQATAIDAIVDDISQGISSHIEGLRKKLGANTMARLFTPIKLFVALLGSLISRAMSASNLRHF